MADNDREEVPPTAVRKSFEESWSHAVIGATSGLLFCIVIASIYGTYVLTAPYAAGISSAIILSIVLRPNYHTANRDQCVSKMVKLNEAYHDCGLGWRVLVSWWSLRYFFELCFRELGMFLGLQKFSLLAHFPLLMIFATVSIVVVLCVITLGILPFMLVHGSVIIICLLQVPILHESVFVDRCGSLWRVVLVVYTTVCLGYSFTLDVVTITSKVRDAGNVASKTVSEGDLVNLVANTVKDRLLVEVALAFNASNVTKTAEEVQQIVQPLLANLSWANYSHYINRLAQTLDMDSSDVDSMSHLSARAAQAFLPILNFAFDILVLALMNIIHFFDKIYEVLLFVMLYRHLSRMKHTVVYYCLARLLSALSFDGDVSLAKARAKEIEIAVVVPFHTLFMSYWHKIWFHFVLTFFAFNYWNLPVPFLSGIGAALLGLVPILPTQLKWINPCGIAFVVTAIVKKDIFSPDQLTLMACIILTYADESLMEIVLETNDGLANGQKKKVRFEEERANFLLGTSIALGIVAYGFRGIVLGPLTAIFARTLFQNWGPVVSSTIRNSAVFRLGMSPQTPALGLRRDSHHGSSATFEDSLKELDMSAEVPLRDEGAGQQLCAVDEEEGSPLDLTQTWPGLMTDKTRLDNTDASVKPTSQPKKGGRDRKKNKKTV